jgi:hypothetical protein
MHAPFGQLCVALLRPRNLVELGTQKGMSYCCFLEAAHVLAHPMRAWAVDHWHGDQHTGAYDPETYAQLKAYHDPRYGDHSTLLRMSFNQAAVLFDEGTLDLVHIDGLHTYEAVRADFETWLPKASERAVFLFHDTDIRSGDFGVWRLWQELESRYPTLHFEFGYGLGVAAVGPNVPAPMRDLFDLDADSQSVLLRACEALGDRVRLAASCEALLQSERSIEAQATHLKQVYDNLFASATASAEHARREIERLRQELAARTPSVPD